MLSERREGIIATSACLGGPVANNFLHGRPDLARDYAGKLAEIFGKDRFYIEIQDHGIKEQIETNRELIPLAREMGLLARRDERRPLLHRRGRAGPGHAGLRPDEHHAQRPKAPEVGERPALFQESRRRWGEYSARFRRH